MGPQDEAVTQSLVLSRQSGGVVLLHDDSYAEKSGTRIRRAEAVAMRLVAKHTAVPVPEVIFDLFPESGDQDGQGPSAGCIGMTVAPGVSLEKVWLQLGYEARDAICSQVWELVAELRKIPRPASIAHLFQSSADGSPSQDVLLAIPRFLDEKTELRPTTLDLRSDDELRSRIFHNYLLANGRRHEHDLLDMLPRSSLSVFTHADLAPRNLMVDLEAHPPRVSGLLDWENAGWYPPYWELANILAPTCRFHDWQERMQATMPKSLGIHRYDLSGISAARRVLF